MLAILVTQLLGGAHVTFPDRADNFAIGRFRSRNTQPQHLTAGFGVKQGVASELKEFENGNHTLNVDALSTALCGNVSTMPDPFVGTGSGYRPFSFPQPLAHDTRDADRVVLLSHGRIQWFDIKTLKTAVVLVKPGQKYRGIFVSNNSTWIVLTTPNMREESLFVEIDPQSGREIRSTVAEKTKDGHDAVRYGDAVYVVSTGTGSLNIYDAVTLELRRELRVFSKRQHINTVAVGPSELFVMLHNLHRSLSEIHVLRRHAAQSVKVYPKVGLGAHGIVKWQNYIVSLDSSNGALVLIDRLTQEMTPVWKCQKPCFLKGLAVINGTAVFGRSLPVKRTKRTEVKMNLTAVALRVSLSTTKELYNV
jgi:hypothetical protein